MQEANSTQVFLLRPEIWHVEDEVHITNSLKNKLQTPILSGCRLLIPGYKVFKTLDEIKEGINELSNLSLLKYKKPIIDINLGPQRKTEGLDVIKALKDSYRGFGFFPIIYSANTDDEYKERFKKLGGDESHFIEKLSSGDGTQGDAKMLINCIQKDLEKGTKEELAPDSPHLLVANGKSKKTSYQITGAYISSKELAEFNNKKTARSYLFDFWTHPLKSGLNFLSLYQHLLSVEIKDELFFHVSDFIAQLADEDNVDGLIFQLQGKQGYVCIPDFETLENAVGVVYEYIAEEDNLANRLIDYLMAQRMATLYIKGSEAEKSKITSFLDQLRFEESKLAFDCKIWEAKAKGELEALPEKSAFPTYPINDLYYGEVVEVEEVDARVRLETVSPAGEYVPFFKQFNLQALQYCGIFNENARFKLVMYQTERGGGYLVLPVPPNMSF